MILFADSGSTKTEWILLNGKQEIFRTQTIGLNPFFVNESQIIEAVQASGIPPYFEQINELHFYGAGCSAVDKVAFLETCFQQLFPKATILIFTDIDGAVIATTDQKPGIVCILGTGSTFRIFDGKGIIRKYSSLSYIIGDEGSGTHIAKALLRGVFYQNFSQKIQDAFFKEYPITANDVLEHVYKKTLPNRYLASFVPFCKKYIDEPEIKALVKHSFTDFINQHLVKYEESKQFPIHFVGSVAFHFQDILMEVLADFGMQPGKILQKPLDNIVANYLNTK